MLNFGFMLETATEEGGGNWFTNNIFLIIMIAVMAVFLIWSSYSNKKQRKKEAEQMDMLAPGDEVITIGGIIGMVVSVKEDTFVLETTKDKTKIRFLKAAIKSVEVRAADKAAAVIAEKEAAKKAEAEEAEPTEEAEKKD